MQRPGAEAALQEGIAELRLAGGGVGEVSERSVEGLQAVGETGVDHLADRVVPEILLVERPLGAAVAASIGQYAIVGMPAADARGLHAARGSQIGRSEAHAVHARGGGGDGLDIVDALGRLEDGVDEDRLLDAMLGFELGKQLVEVVDVPRPLDLGQHDDVELVADGGDDLAHVVEHPRAVEAVDARPQAGRSEIVVARHSDEASARGFLLVGGDGVLEVAQHDVDLTGDVLDLGADLLVVRRHEMNHALQPHGERAVGFRSADGEWGVEFLRGAAGGHRDWNSRVAAQRTLLARRREST